MRKSKIKFVGDEFKKNRLVLFNYEGKSHEVVMKEVR